MPPPPPKINRLRENVAKTSTASYAGRQTAALPWKTGISRPFALECRTAHARLADVLQPLPKWLSRSMRRGVINLIIILKKLKILLDIPSCRCYTGNVIPINESCGLGGRSKTLSLNDKPANKS
jgi:hypothetical protein